MKLAFIMYETANRLSDKKEMTLHRFVQKAFMQFTEIKEEIEKEQQHAWIMEEEEEKDNYADLQFHPRILFPLLCWN